MLIQNQLLASVRQQESGGDPMALSPKGAAGAYQIMPATAAKPGYGVTPLRGWDGRDPRTAPYAEQERFANDYLNAMSRHFDNNTAKTLAAYNAGPGAVEKYGGVPPFKETQDYVQKVGGDLVAASNDDWLSRAVEVPMDAAPQAPASDDWLSRAQEVENVPLPAAPPAAAPVKEEGFIAGVKDAWKHNIGQMEGSADAYVAGQQTLPETVAQQGLNFASIVPDVLMEGVSAVTPDVVKDALKGTAMYAAEKTLGKEFVDSIPQKLQDFQQEYPRASRNISAGLDAASLIPSPLAVGVGAKAAGGVVKSGRAFDSFMVDRFATEKPVQRTAAEVKDMAGASFKQAQDISATFTPEEISVPFGKAIQETTPKPIAGVTLTSEDKKLAQHLAEYEGLGGKPLTMDEVKRLDEGMTMKINQNFVDARTGLPDANGKKLMDLQTKLRNMLDDIPENPANDALTNARKLWKAQIIMNELDTIAERASMTQNVATSLKAGYRNLYMDKDRIRGWPPEAKELLKKAAQSGWKDDAMQLLSSRLPAIVMGGTGNIGGAATAHVVGAAGRGVMANVVAKRGARIQQSVANDTINNLRKVTPSGRVTPKAADVPQLLLAPPSKMSPLGMTDKEVNISKRLMEPTKTGPELSGAAIRPPVSQLTKLQDTLAPKARKGLDSTIQDYRAGKLSKNKFTEMTAAKFGLSRAEARALAEEIKTYGDTTKQPPPGPLQLTIRPRKGEK